MLQKSGVLPVDATKYILNQKRRKLHNVHFVRWKELKLYKAKRGLVSMAIEEVDSMDVAMVVKDQIQIKVADIDAALEGGEMFKTIYFLFRTIYEYNY